MLSVSETFIMSDHGTSSYHGDLSCTQYACFSSNYCIRGCRVVIWLISLSTKIHAIKNLMFLLVNNESNAIIINSYLASPHRRPKWDSLVLFTHQFAHNAEIMPLTTSQYLKGHPINSKENTQKNFRNTLNVYLFLYHPSWS